MIVQKDIGAHLKGMVFLGLTHSGAEQVHVGRVGQDAGPVLGHASDEIDRVRDVQAADPCPDVSF